ncbi:hypothetical protein [Maridesulfovibrio sp. FT414]|uniref:hypothetical protein n=1 Tax=Maridesulfovibrio sp. FT414 TaxID=2979469 RepID=UPI003D809B3D
MVKPEQQGSLDSLCGIYSIINAVCTLTGEEAQPIFEKIIFYLENKGHLSTVLTSGTNINIMGSILKELNCDDVITRKMPFRGQKAVPLAQFWESMQSHLSLNTKDKNRTSILLCLGKTYDHWTIVSSISDKRIMLSDSANLKFLNRTNCTTSEDHRIRRQHILYPQYTYFFQTKD